MSALGNRGPDEVRDLFRTLAEEFGEILTRKLSTEFGSGGRIAQAAASGLSRAAGVAGGAVAGGVAALGQAGTGVGDFLSGAEYALAERGAQLARATAKQAVQALSGGVLEGDVAGEIAFQGAKAAANRTLLPGFNIRTGTLSQVADELGPLAAAFGLAGQAVPQDLIDQRVDIVRQQQAGVQGLLQGIRASLSRWDDFTLGQSVRR